VVMGTPRAANGSTGPGGIRCGITEVTKMDRFVDPTSKQLKDSMSRQWSWIGAFQVQGKPNKRSGERDEVVAALGHIDQSGRTSSIKSEAVLK